MDVKMKKLYCIGYEIDSDEDKVVSSLKKISQDIYFRILSKVFFIYTDKTDTQIFDILQPLFKGGKGRFFVVEVEKSKINGWTSVYFKEWIDTLPK